MSFKRQILAWAIVIIFVERIITLKIGTTVVGAVATISDAIVVVVSVGTIIQCDWEYDSEDGDAHPNTDDGDDERGTIQFPGPHPHPPLPPRSVPILEKKIVHII